MTEPLSQRLTRWSEEFDRIFNHVLGYVIAFTSLVAFADVLGNGQVLQFSPILYWVWVLAQGLCVEFQVFILIKRMPGYWQANRLMFWLYGAFIGCLCLMSIMVGSVFVQHDQEHGSIEQAMNALGIPHIGFIYARAALAILLVALIAIDRAIEQHRQDGRQGEQDRHDAVQSDVIERLEEMAVQQAEMAAILAQVITTVNEVRTVLPTLEQGVHTSITTMSEMQAKHVLLVQSTVREVQGVSTAVNELRTAMPELVQHHLAARLETVQQGVIEHFQPLLSASQASQVQDVHDEPHLELLPRLGSSVIGEIVQRFIESELEKGHLPTLSEIMQATGCSKGSASRYRSLLCKESSA